MNRVQMIKCMKGEEKPGLIATVLLYIYNCLPQLRISPVVNEATRYRIECDGVSLPYQVCDSSGSSPDLITEFEEGPNDFIEITKGSFRGSGNNSQYQRFTKFIPVLLDPLFNLIYFFDTSDTTLKGKTKLAMQCWKKNNIQLVTTNPALQTVFDSLDTNFTIESFANNWNQMSKPSPSGPFKGRTQTIRIETESIRIEDFNILKNDRITHDPGIGTLMLVLSTLLQFKTGKNILIANHGLSQELIDRSRGNKFLKFVCILKQKFNNEIELEGITMPQCKTAYESLNCPSTSEKIVSIHEELELKEKYLILYNNHARSEQEYLVIGSRKISINRETLRPDIIYADTENKIIYMVEAERFCNYETGVRQIESWRSEVTKNFYTTSVAGSQYEGYQFKAYIILYDSGNRQTNCNQRYVKKIVNSRRETYENDNFETLDLF